MPPLFAGEILFYCCASRRNVLITISCDPLPAIAADAASYQDGHWALAQSGESARGQDLERGGLPSRERSPWGGRPRAPVQIRGVVPVHALSQKTTP